VTLAVVIGDGVDELVAAHYLRKGGHDVTLVHSEGRGLQRDTEPGWVPPYILRDLTLDQHGFAVMHSAAWARVPLADAGALDLLSDIGQCAQSIRRVSTRDAERWPEFCARMHALAQVLADIYCALPPDPLASDLGDAIAGARAALRVRGLGRQGIEDLLRLLPMSIADFLDEWFENDGLKGALAAQGVTDLCQGTRSSGTAFNFLHRHVGSAPGMFRPARSNVRHVLCSLGGIHARDGEVARVLTRAGRAIGVALASGETIAADVVVSGLDPARTLMQLADPGLLDPRLVRALRNVRSRGVAARLTLEVETMPEWLNLVIAPSLDYLERAYDDVKHGRVSDKPYIEAHAATVGGSGRSRVDVCVQYVPQRMSAQANNDARAAIAALVKRELAPHLQDIADVSPPSVLTPPDLQAQYGWPQGQPCHAEIALDQALWMRPLPELARYRTPIAGLYLCGPAMHPGGPVAGAAGANAAAVILRDRKRRGR
jgi:phytoene dehydrogenase-like protein